MVIVRLAYVQRRDEKILLKGTVEVSLMLNRNRNAPEYLDLF